MPRRVVRELNWTVSAPPPSQKNKRPLPMKSKPFSAIRYPSSPLSQQNTTTFIHFPATRSSLLLFSLTRVCCTPRGTFFPLAAALLSTRVSSFSASQENEKRQNEKSVRRKEDDRMAKRCTNANKITSARARPLLRTASLVDERGGKEELDSSVGIRELFHFSAIMYTLPDDCTPAN